MKNDPNPSKLQKQPDRKETPRDPLDLLVNYRGVKPPIVPSTQKRVEKRPKTVHFSNDFRRKISENGPKNIEPDVIKFKKRHKTIKFT